MVDGRRCVVAGVAVRAAQTRDGCGEVVAVTRRLVEVFIKAEHLHSIVEKFIFESVPLAQKVKFLAGELKTRKQRSSTGSQICLSRARFIGCAQNPKGVEMKLTLAIAALIASTLAASAQWQTSSPYGPNGPSYTVGPNGQQYETSCPYGANGPCTTTGNGQRWTTSRPYGPNGPSYTTPDYPPPGGNDLHIPRIPQPNYGDDDDNDDDE